MKNKINIMNLTFIVLGILPLVVTLILLPSLPEKMPVHYGFYGNVDRFGSKYENLIFPILIIFLALFLLLYSHSKKNVTKNKSFNIIGFSIICLSNLFIFISLYNCFSPKIYNTTNLTNAALCLFFIICGNFLPKLRKNGFLGIRVSWTLKNETVWNKTHRLGGFIWVVGGCIMLPLCLFAPTAYASIIMFSGLLLLVIIPILYSYIIYKKITK